MEDGTGEALVLCRNQHVAAMLGLSLLEWEAVQSCVQSRGSLFIQYGEATGTGCVEELEDPIACYLRNLCRSSLICRPILLDFSLDRKPPPEMLQPTCSISGVCYLEPRSSFRTWNAKSQDSITFTAHTLLPAV